MFWPRALLEYVSPFQNTDLVLQRVLLALERLLVDDLDGVHVTVLATLSQPDLGKRAPENVSLLAMWSDNENVNSAWWLGVLFHRAENEIRNKINFNLFPTLILNNEAIFAHILHLQISTFLQNYSRCCNWVLALLHFNVTRWIDDPNTDHNTECCLSAHFLHYIYLIFLNVETRTRNN